jgi:DNA-binding CsgD family transcriptional regulator
VFAGGISFDAARAIALSGQVDANEIETLAGLVDQSLLRQETLANGEPSFRLLETIREYASEQLAATGELGEIQHRHAAYYCELAETAETELRGINQVTWLERLEWEWPNLRAALAWCDRSGEIELGLRLATALGWFWYLRGGDRREGRTWLERFAGRSASLLSAAAVRARALSEAGFFAQYQLDLASATSFQETALALGRKIASQQIIALALVRLAHLGLFRSELEPSDKLAARGSELYQQLGDRWGMAFALATRGLIARSQDRTDDGTRYLSDSLSLFRQQGDRWGIAHALLGLGQVALRRGDDRQAEQCWEERLRLSRELGSQTAVAHTLDLLATVARQRGNRARAAAWFEEALAIQRKIGNRQAIAWALQGIGELALVQGDARTTYANLRESLMLRQAIAEQAGIVASLVAFARLAAALRRPRRALRLAGAAEALCQTMGPTRAVQHFSQGALSTALAPDDPDVLRAQRLLGRIQRTAAWEEGIALSLEQAVAEALELEAELVASTEKVRSNRLSRLAPLPADLTRREREVAALLARGQTNRQIAETLIVTEGTAHLHVVRLLNKLGFHTRAQVAVWAVTHGLVPNSSLDVNDREHVRPN